MMSAVRITVAAGLILLAGAIAIVASHSPPDVARASSAPANSGLGESYGPARVCQGGEVLPAATSAIRLLIHSPVVGPRVTVAVIAGEQILAEGRRESGWTAGAVTVPVKSASQTISGVTVCFAFGRSTWLVGLTGRRTRPAVAARFDGQPMIGRVGIEYLRQGRRSWWSRALSMAGEMGLGHAGGGARIPLLVLVLMVSIGGLSSWLAIRELR
jgi:hypothetical protein